MKTATKSINLISKSSTFGPGRTDHFMEELPYVLTNSFVPCVPVRFFFSLPLIFTLLAAGISHFLTAAMKFHVFLPTKFASFVFNHSL